MFERMTERARQVVVLAQDEARGMAHGQIGTEHLLLGLLREEQGLAARALEALDVTIVEVRKSVLSIIGEGGEVVEGNLPFTPRAKKVLELALREALSLGHNYIGTEHILLGLVRENEGVAARILLDFGASADTVRERIVRMLSGPERRWSRADVDLQQIWVKGQDVFRVVAIADAPTVIVENVTTGVRGTYVISSELFGAFTLLEPRGEGDTA